MGFLEQITGIYFFTFFVIFLRVTSFYFAAPVFGGAGVPPHTKIGLGLLTSVIMLFVVDMGSFRIPGTMTEFFLIASMEVVVGILLGYAVSLLFAGVQFAGMLMGYQMGFAVANVLDPTSNEQVSILGQFLFIFAILYFLALDGHHLLIRALVDSYTLAPPLGIGITGDTIVIIVRIFTGMFYLGLQIALPIIGTLFLIDVGLGIVAKTVPQMNVFIIGLPLKSLVGLIVLTITFGLISVFIRIEVGKLAVNVYWLIRSLFIGG